MKKIKLTASNLRIILAICIILTVALGVSLFIFSYNSLTSTATEVGTVTGEAQAMENKLQNLQQTEKQLSQQKDVIDRASAIVAESQSYQYQDQIINDLNTYAAKTGIEITNFTFTDGSTPGASTTKTATPAATTTSVNGVKSTSVSITLRVPINYQNLLNFMHYIEQNLTKMQLSSVALTRDAATDEITTGALTVQVYTR